MKIEIVRVPAGPAPEWAREAWVGVRIAEAQIRWKLAVVDFEGNDIGERNGFLVLSVLALEALREKDKLAASWFYENLPHTIPTLFFETADVIVVDS